MIKKILLIITSSLLILSSGVKDICAGNFNYNLNVDFEDSNLKGSTNIQNLTTVGNGEIADLGYESSKSLYLNDVGLNYILNTEYDLTSFDLTFYVKIKDQRTLSQFDTIVYFGGLDDYIKPVELEQSYYTFVGATSSSYTSVDVDDGSWHQLHIYYNSSTSNGRYVYYLDGKYIGCKYSTNLITSIEFNAAVNGESYKYSGYIDNINLSFTGEEPTKIINLSGYDANISKYESYFEPLARVLNQIEEWNSIIAFIPYDSNLEGNFKVILMNKDVKDIYAENANGSLLYVSNGVGETDNINFTERGLWFGRYNSQEYNLNDIDGLKKMIQAYVDFFENYIATNQFDNSILEGYKKFEAMGSNPYTTTHQIFSNGDVLYHVKGDYRVWSGSYNLLFSVRGEVKENGFYLQQHNPYNLILIGDFETSDVSSFYFNTIDPPKSGKLRFKVEYEAKNGIYPNYYFKYQTKSYLGTMFLDEDDSISGLGFNYDTCLLENNVQTCEGEIDFSKLSSKYSDSAYYKWIFDIDNYKDLNGHFKIYTSYIKNFGFSTESTTLDGLYRYDVIGKDVIVSPNGTYRLYFNKDSDIELWEFDIYNNSYKTILLQGFKGDYKYVDLELSGSIYLRILSNKESYIVYSIETGLNFSVVKENGDVEISTPGEPNKTVNVTLESPPDILNNDWTTIDGAMNSVKLFLTQNKRVIQSIFSVPMTFYNSLNLTIKTVILGLFSLFLLAVFIRLTWR